MIGEITEENSTEWLYGEYYSKDLVNAYGKVLERNIILKRRIQGLKDLICIYTNVDVIKEILIYFFIKMLAIYFY